MIVNNAKNSLADFVELNEAVKSIVKLAADVELMSINALIANKSSTAESGFTAVAYELSGFSLGVSEGAKQLSTQFSLIISQIAFESNLHRRNKTLRETKSKSAIADQYILSARSDVEKHLKLLHLKFKSSANTADLLLQKIERMGIVGTGLSGFGKIESTYLGSSGTMLYKIAEDVGSIIVEISNIILEIKERIKRYTA